MIGAEAIRILLDGHRSRKADGAICAPTLQSRNGGEKPKKMVKRLKVVEAFIEFRQSPGMDDA